MWIVDRLFNPLIPFVAFPVYNHCMISIYDVVETNGLTRDD